MRQADGVQRRHKTKKRVEGQVIAIRQLKALVLSCSSSGARSLNERLDRFAFDSLQDQVENPAVFEPVVRATASCTWNCELPQALPALQLRASQAPPTKSFVLLVSCRLLSPAPGVSQMVGQCCDQTFFTNGQFDQTKALHDGMNDVKTICTDPCASIDAVQHEDTSSSSQQLSCSWALSLHCKTSEKSLWILSRLFAFLLCG